MTRVRSTRLENITLKKNLMVLIFNESFGQKWEDAPNWGCWDTKKLHWGTPTGTSHAGRRKPRANFNVNLCRRHLRDTQSPSDGSGVPGMGGERAWMKSNSSEG